MTRTKLRFETLLENTVLHRTDTNKLINCGYDGQTASISIY